MSDSCFSNYDPAENRQSIYCYKDSDVLINKENIRDAKALAQYEADITMFRLYQLEKEQPIKGRFGITHLKRIHKYIFQDIYPFAGKFRIENIYKGSTPFCQWQFIEENLKKLFNELKKDNYLRGMNPEEFSKKALTTCLNLILYIRLEKVMAVISESLCDSWLWMPVI